MINRHLTNKLKISLTKRRAIILVGARQVGKTTLVKTIANELNYKWEYWNCDEPDIRQMLNSPTSTLLRNLVGNNQLIIIDEAQRIADIEITLKLLIDSIPDVKLIITGSSSLNLRSTMSEPLTGRKFELTLYPISFAELSQESSLIDQNRLLIQRVIYGMYPDIINNPGDEPDRLLELASSYLYKDILMIRDIRKPDILDRLITALALQLGSEVSYNELSQTVGVNKDTISKYIDLLQKSYVIFALNSFSRNMRNELKKSKKIYFYDNGIRNAIIKNFNPPELRTDIGPLWENFLIMERIKHLSNTGVRCNSYFWRTVQNQEIDYLEDMDGHIKAFEFKWNPKAKYKISPTFKNMYPDSDVMRIDTSNYTNFIT